MPARPHSICRQPGCGAATAKPGYCSKHAKSGGGWQPDRERGSRHERGYDAEWERTRKRILARAKGLCECADCKALDRIRVAREVDHIVSKANGGSDDDDNLQAINVDCHKAKTQRERAVAQREAAPVARWIAGAWVMPARRR
ncbi:HNH endonuclease [Cupriavidus plantarum]|uniref:HNH endonuclease n=1 Tax=Cupriavidus plantarum TaxID=942865 RepID=UPI000EB30ECC|nr:HNH endonuclease [Cupriavidus plantarum]RLK45958.1 5-methylcytosine-specific restriction protein A [Cupriavidus plantarum]